MLIQSWLHLLDQLCAGLDNKFYYDVPGGPNQALTKL